MVLIFDAANTLIYKPALYVNFQTVLFRHGFAVNINNLIKNHTILLHAIEFPDTTSQAFYYNFNKEILYSLGIVPSEVMLDELFKECSYLDWEVYADTSVLKELPYEMGVASNFNKGLEGVLNIHFQDKFKYKLISENVNYRKPDIRFYEHLLADWNLDPKDILYIGDSIKLDVEPAMKLGINAYLIDRNNYFPFVEKRIKTLHELPNLIARINE